MRIFLSVAILTLTIQLALGQPETEELVIKGAPSVFKVASGATVSLTNSATILNVINSGTLKLEAGGSLITDGAVNLASGSSVQVDGSLELKGHWTNDATASTALAGATLGTITFNGTANQNIGGSVSTNFENVSIDNALGVTLTNNQTIGASLTFSNGSITTGANRLDMTGTSADNVSGSGIGRYILGNFRRYVTTSVQYTLPIGTAANYEMGRLFVNSQTGLTYVDVSFTVSNQNPPPPLTVQGVAIDNFLDYGYWTLTPNAGVTSVNYDFSGQSIGHTDLGPDEFYYSLITNIGAGWQDLGIHSNATQTYSATMVLAKRSQLTSFGSYIVAHAAATVYVAPTVTEELRIAGTTSIFKVSSGGTVSVTNSGTAINTSSSGVLKVETGGTFVTDGSVNLASSSSIQVDGDLIVKGDWTNDATASTALAGAALGTVTFNGTVNQNIGGSVTTIFENFSIDNATGVTLTNNQTVSVGLLFINGIITTNANRLEMTATAADNVSGGGTGKYVLGNFRRYITTSVEYTIPIGTATNYEMGRLFINNQTGLTYVDATFTISNENPPPPLTVQGVAINDFLDYGFWTLVPNGGAIANYDFSGQSIGHTDQGPDEFYYSLISDLGGGWQDLGVHSNATQTYNATTVLAKRSQLTSFGSYIVAHATATVYVAPPVTEELKIEGTTSIFKVASGATVNLTNSVTALNTSSSGVLKVETGGALSADGSINIASGSSIQVDGILSLKGNWANDATASTALAGAALGTINFNGTANQNIGGTVTTIFENFAIDNVLGVTLTNNQTISAALSFTNGIITTGANRLDMTGASADNVSGSGTGNYVFGNFRRFVTTAIQYTLPIGTATNYEMGRLFVNSQAGLTYVDVGFTISNQNPPPLITVKGVTINDFLDYGYWTLTANGGATANYDFSGQSIGHTDQGPDEFAYSLISNLGAGWQDLGVHSIATQTYNATTVLAKRGQLTSFGSYIIGHSIAPIYVAPPVIEEILIGGATSIFKVATGATVNLTNSVTGLTTSNSGTLKLHTGGTLNTDGAVILNSGSSIQVDGSMALKGNWTNNATASTALAGASIGTITFNGTANQNVGGSVATVFENFTINNATGVTLTSNQTISAALTFTNGIISTGANRLDMTGTAADNVSGGGPGRYVLGNFRRYVATAVQYTLPIGTATNYEMGRLFVNSQTGLTYVDIAFTVSNQNPPPVITVKGVPINDFLDYGYWTLTPNGGGTANYDFSGQSIGHTDRGPTEFFYALISNLGGGWQDLGVHSIATQTYSATTVLAKRSQLSGFGSYIIGHTLTPIYVAPVVTEETLVKGATSIFKVASGGTVTLTNSTTMLNTSNNGTLKVQTGGTLVANGPVNLASGSSIQVDGNLSVRGNWTNNGTASTALAGATIGTITFNGTANQNIGGTTIFENFIINNASGVTLASNQSVSETLTFTNGVITTGAFKVSCTNASAATLPVGPNTSFVFGTLEKAIATNTSTYNFSVGRGTASTTYHPLQFINNNLTGVSSLAVSVASITEVPPNADANLNPTKAIEDGVLINNIFETAEWVIAPNAAPTGGSYGLNLFVTNIAGLSAADNDAFVILKRPLASTTYDDWDTFFATTTIPADGAPGRVYNAGNGYAQKTGFTAFSRVAIGRTATPLPIELLLFTARYVNTGVLVEWITASELNNDYFSIERSRDAVDWSELAQVDGAGNSTQVLKYNYVDEKPLYGESFYRLKQTDFDGNFEYSHIARVNILDNKIQGFDFQIYPNPSDGENVTLIIQNEFQDQEDVLITISDLTGRFVHSNIIIPKSSERFSVINISLNKLAQGMYFITGTSSKTTKLKRLIIK